MLNLPTSNYEELTDPETSDSGEIQKPESERSPRDTGADISDSFVGYTGRFELHSGPFPDSDTFERYQAIYPQAAEVLFTQFQKVNDHYISMNEKDREDNERNREADRQNFVRGQYIAALVCLGCMVIALVMALQGDRAWAAAIALSSITVLAGKAITSNFSKRGSSIERSP